MCKRGVFYLLRFNGSIVLNDPADKPTDETMKNCISVAGHKKV
jgi:hypothetical protein